MPTLKTCWQPPLKHAIKVMFDAACSKERAIIGFVTFNHKSEIIHHWSTKISSTPTEVVETLALK